MITPTNHLCPVADRLLLAADPALLLDVWRLHGRAGPAGARPAGPGQLPVLPSGQPAGLHRAWPGARQQQGQVPCKPQVEFF